MANKYSVKHQDEGIWNGMAMTDSEAKMCAQLGHPEIPLEEMTAEIVPFLTDARRTSEDGQSGVATGANTPSKTRKPRSGIGKTRLKALKPAKKIRPDGTYFLIEGRYTQFTSKKELYEDLDAKRGAGQEVTALPIIHRGRVSMPSIHYKLK